MKAKINSNRDLIRWSGILVGVGCLVFGVMFPVPLTIGKTGVSNAILFTGIIILLLTFGIVQLVKAWTNRGQSQQK